MIPLFKVYMSQNAETLLKEVLNSGYIGQGEKTELFEQKLCSFLGVDNLVTTNSATSALHLAYRLCGSSNKTVLTTPLTCIATNASAIAENAKIQWVDINPNTFNIDVEDLERKLFPARGTSRNFAAIVVVHWGGMPADMDAIQSLAKKANIPIIEDCAHAWGSTYDGKLVGTQGNLAAFSFQAVKPVTCGDGGVLICPTESSKERAKKLRWYGVNRSNQSEDVAEIGFKYHMNDINASIGLANIEHDTIHRRQEIARWYDVLKDSSGITLQEKNSKGESSSYLYTIKVEDRENFEKMMNSKGIETRLPHLRNDKYSAFKYFKETLPNLDSVADSLTCIPCGWWLSYPEQQYIVDSIAEGW